MVSVIQSITKATREGHISKPPPPPKVNLTNEASSQRQGTPASPGPKLPPRSQVQAANRSPTSFRLIQVRRYPQRHRLVFPLESDSASQVSCKTRMTIGAPS